MFQSICAITGLKTMRLRYGTFIIWTIAVIWLSAGSLLYAQGGASGTFVGVVKDSTGSVVPGATVTIRNLDTNQSQNDISRESGEYTFPYVAAGDYEVKATRDGF